MKYRMYLRVLLVLLFLALAAFAHVQAQEHPNVARGFNPAGAFASGDLDTINYFNGNLMISLPLGQSYPVNGGLSYGLSLVYNSQVWEHQSYDTVVQAIPSRVANAGLGWMVSLGRLNPPQFLGDFDTFRNTYMSPDGGRHTFYPTLHEGESDANAEAGIEYTRDGTYLRLNVAARQVEFSDGTIHTFDASGFPTQIRDRFENQVNICYSTTCGAVANSWWISDSQGRVHWVYFKNTGISSYQQQVVDRVDVAAFGGARATYTFRYNFDDFQSVVVTGCRNNDPQTANLSVALLTSLSLPDGTSYSMPVADHFTADTTPCKAGMIHRLTLPTLGKIEWDYINYQFPAQSSPLRTFWQRATGVGSRMLIDAGGTPVGTWTYSTSPTFPTTELVNSVTDPLGHRVTRYFSVCANSSNCGGVTDRLYEYGLPLSRDQAGDGTGRFLSSQVFHQNGTLLRSTYVRYERDLGPGYVAAFEDRPRFNQRLASQRTVFHDDGNLYADETFSNFDGLGHYRSHSTGGNFPGSNVRTSTVGYNPGQGTYPNSYTVWPTSSPWVLNTYSFSWESEGSQLLYRSYCFDSATGFLTGRRVHGANDAGYRTNDFVQVFARDTAGNLTSESYYGGDNHTISTDPTQGFICSLVGTLSSPSYRINHIYSRGVRATSSYTVAGTTLKVLDQTIDLSTGLASSSRDASGVQTIYSYDSSSRPTSVQSPDAPLGYTYRNATSASSLARVTAGRSTAATTYYQSRVTYDAFGRATLEEEQMPDNQWEARRTLYNALGWKTYVSAQGALGYGTSFDLYDPFGRPGRIRPQDGNTHDITLTYTGARQVQRKAKVATSATGESFATTTEVYDRFGRLHEVTEPNGTVTRYEYDAGNHLKRVCQAVTSTGACGQERLFTYDNRGVLLWENHPEKTANVYGLSHDVDYHSYDARGHLLRKVDGDNDLTFQYDAAERLTQVRQTGAGACVITDNGTGPLCLKTFTYATSNGTNAAGLTDYRKGKITSASRYNYAGAPFNVTAEVKETYEYAGRGGRISQKDTFVLSQAFRQTFTWDELGALASQTYPDCIAATWCGPSSPRSISYGYTKGRLTSVSGFANSITYHPNGLVHTVSRSNGVTDYQDRDPNWFTRPAAIYALRNSDSFGMWNTGTYQYDGSGNVWKMGTTTYVYDSLSRVVSGTVYPGAYSNGTAHTQSYTYDNYGNLKDITTNGVFLNTQTATATNRLTGGSYDRAGNLIGWSGNTYEYDAFNQMKKMVSGAEDWRYVYTADDERIWNVRTTGNLSVYTLRGLDDKVLREYSVYQGGWSNYRDSIYRDSTLLASVDSAAAGGAVRHLHTDHLGTPRLITDATGSPATAKFHTYYPFGQEIAGTYTTSYTDRMRFTGHERDLANISGQGDDLDYMHARHHSPLLGRFLSLDRVTGTPKDPRSWNRYSYARGNPLRFVDPDGRTVVVAPELRKTVLHAYANSASFRTAFDTVHQNKSILAFVRLGSGGNMGTSSRGETAWMRFFGRPKDSKSYTGYLQLLIRGMGQGRYDAKSDRDLAGRIGHELAHAAERAEHGKENAPETRESGSDRHKGETDQALQTENDIVSELAKSMDLGLSDADITSILDASSEWDQFTTEQQQQCMSNVVCLTLFGREPY